MGTARSNPRKAAYSDSPHSFIDFERVAAPVRVPPLWDVPAARTILLGTYDRGCSFSRASTRVVETLLPNMVDEAYQTNLLSAVASDDLPAVSCVCLFAPHRIVRERQDSVQALYPLSILTAAHGLAVPQRDSAPRSGQSRIGGGG